jgi:hypothetical protein
MTRHVVNSVFLEPFQFDGVGSANGSYREPPLFFEIGRRARAQVRRHERRAR